MTVYVIIKSTLQTFENEACWDDGWYDDYYETQVTSEELIGIYASEELAKKVTEKENEKCDGYYATVYYFPYEVIEYEETNRPRN